MIFRRPIVRLLLLAVFACAPLLRAADSLAELRAKAEKGDAAAQIELGEKYYNGEDVAEDDAEAVKWFRKAAEQGNVNAQNKLGVAYAIGEGVMACPRTK